MSSRLRTYDRVVAISRSGTTFELIDAVTRVRSESPPTRITVLLGEQGTPIDDATNLAGFNVAIETSGHGFKAPTPSHTWAEPTEPR